MAREVLRLYDLGGVGALHRQSRRFCDSGYGTPGDPGLRPLLLQLADGSTVESLAGQAGWEHLIRWLAAFRHVFGS